MKSEPTILVAEDNESDVLLLEYAFQKSKLGVPLHVARDGQEAIEYLKAAAKSDSLPELLLLDLQMPRFNGFEVLEWIRAQPTLKRMVVVVFTTSNLDDDINRAYDLGVNSYLVKPMETGTLVELVKEIRDYWLLANIMPDCRSKFSIREHNEEAAVLLLP